MNSIQNVATIAHFVHQKISEIENSLSKIGLASDRGDRTVEDIAREIGPTLQEPCTAEDKDKFQLLCADVDRHFRRRKVSKIPCASQSLFSFSESEQILLDALLSKKIVAYRNNRLPPEYWMGHSPGAVEWGDYHFWSAKVREHWEQDCPGDPQPAVKHVKSPKAPRNRPVHDFIAGRLEEVGLPPDGGDKSPKALVTIVWRELPKDGEANEASRRRAIGHYLKRIREETPS
jgi:hypothetical protein